MFSTFKARITSLAYYERDEFWWCSSSGTRWARVWLIAIILIATGLRLNRLDASSLWLDEIITETRSQMRLPAMLERTRNNDYHPPLFYMVSSLGRGLGDSDFSARIPVAFAGILSIPAMFVLARRLLKRTFAGLMASLLLATVPFHLQVSQEARSYTLSILLQMIAMYWLYRGLFGNWRWAWLGYALAMIASWYTHYFAFLWLAAQGLFVLLLGLVISLRRGGPGLSGRLARLRRVVVPFVAVLLVCALAYLPWYGVLLTHTQRLMALARLPTHEPGPRSIDLSVVVSIWRAFAERQPVLAIALLVTATTGIIVGLIRRAWAAITYIALSFVVPALMLGTMSTAPYFTPKYGFPLLVPVLLLASQGLAFLYQAAVTAIRRVSLPVTGSALLLIVAAFMIPFGSASYRDQKEDWRAVGQFLESCMGPEDTLVLFNAKLYVARYAPRTADRTWPASSLADLKKAYATGQALWVLLTPYLGPAPDAAQIRDWVAQQPNLNFDFGLAMNLHYLHSGQAQIGLWQEVAQCQIPARPQLWATKARAARQAGQLADAFAAASTAAELEKDPRRQAEYLFDAGTAAFLQGKNEDALRYFDRVLALKPDSADAYVLKAGALLGIGEPAQALEQLKVVFDRFRRDEYWPHRLAGDALASMNRPAEALVHYVRALELSPEEYDLLYHIGVLYEEVGEPKKARPYFEDYVSRRPDGPLAADAWRRLAGRTTRGKVNVQSGQLDQEETHSAGAQQALTPDNQSSSATPGQVERSLRDAQAAAVAGDLAQARALYGELLASENAPAERFKIFMAWAIMERFQPNPPAALDLLEQALRLQPDDVEAHANYGAVLLDANRPADAAREFEFVVSRNPQHFWGYWLGGLAYQRMGQLDQALVALQRAVDLAPDEATRADVVLRIIEVAAQAQNCTVARDFAKRYPSIVDRLGEPQRAFLAACP